MTAGSDIAAEIAAALVEAGEATGDGELVCTLRRVVTPDAAPTAYEAPPGVGGAPAPPGDPTYSYHALTGLDDLREIRDSGGTLTGQVRRTLTVNATGATPVKGEQIAVGVAEADIDSNTVWSKIDRVRPVSPGGVALMYDLDLAR